MDCGWYKFNNPSLSPVEEHQTNFITKRGDNNATSSFNSFRLFYGYVYLP